MNAVLFGAQSTSEYGGCRFGIRRSLASRCLASIWVLLVAISFAGQASARVETLRWQQSDSSNVAGFYVYVGQAPRYYDTRFDAGFPTPSNGVHRLDIQVPDDQSVYVAVTSYTNTFLESAFSNEQLRADPNAPSPPDDPDPPDDPSPPDDPDPPDDPSPPDDPDPPVDPDPPDDPDPPSGGGAVEIEGVGNGQVVSGNLFIEAVANAASVLFLVDGVEFRIENHEPFALTGDDSNGLNPWNTQTVADGIHSITAVAYDQSRAKGNQIGSQTVSFVVQNFVAPPPQCVSHSDCSDGNACNGDEFCSSGSCQSGTAPVCADPGPCQANQCIPSFGCWVTEVANGTTCNDGDSSTSGDVCSSGVCVGVPDSGPSGSGFGVTAISGVGNGQVVSGSLFIEAFADASTESVAFILDGTIVRVEGLAPYSFNGDGATGLNPWDTNQLVDGTHSITAIGYSGDGMSGTEGSRVTVTFVVANDDGKGDDGSDAESCDGTTCAAAAECQVGTCDADLGCTVWVDPGAVSCSAGSCFVGVCLADRGFGVDSLSGVADGQDVAGNLFVEAHADADTRSVRFFVDGIPVRTENHSPFTLAGDSNDIYDILNPWDSHSVDDGWHTLSAVGYDDRDGEGQAGSFAAASFFVDNKSMATHTHVSSINVGGPTFVDPEGRIWLGDEGVEIGGSVTTGVGDVRGTRLGPLYQSARVQNSSSGLAFRVALSADTYRVRLHFVARAGAASHEFDIDLEGAAVASVDIVGSAGHEVALVEEFDVFVGDGALDIELSGTGATLSAIDVSAP